MVAQAPPPAQRAHLASPASLYTPSELPRLILKVSLNCFPSNFHPEYKEDLGPSPICRTTEMKASQTARSCRITPTLVRNTNSTGPPTKSGSLEGVWPENLNFNKRRLTALVPS